MMRTRASLALLMAVALSATATDDVQAQCTPDTVGPDITCTAMAASCPSPLREGGGVPRVPRLVERGELERILLSTPSNEEARQRIAEKLAVLPSQVLVYDGSDPQFRSEPNQALSCGNHCISGTLSVTTNPFYDIAVNCGEGAFTARTGASHSVTTSSGSRQNVIFGGSTLSPGTSDITFHLHNLNMNYLNPPGGHACAFDPPDTPVEPNSTGIEQEWTVASGGFNLLLREEMVAFGSTEANSGIRITLGATNLNPVGGLTAEMGVRWQTDYQNTTDDGPGYAPVVCSPFSVGTERFTEHEMLPSEIEDFYRIRNNTGSPIFSNYTSTTAISGFPGTGTPDRLVYGQWGPMSDSGWNYVTTEGANADFDSATLYYFGYTPGNGVLIGPGESFARSIVIFTSGSGQTCGGFTPGEGNDGEVTICPQTCAAVGATATDNCSVPTVTLLSSSPGAPICAGNPCTLLFPTPGDYVYTWEAEDAASNTTTCTSTVHVLPFSDPLCNQPPSCDGGGPYSSTCRTAAIDGGTVTDPNGDEITYAWSSSNSAVTVAPASGTVPAGAGSRPVPPATATLDAGTAPCGASSTLTLDIDDGRGGTSSCTTVVTFSDDVLPQLQNVPPDTTAECDAVPPPASVTATDNCDPAPAVTFVESRTDGNCPGNYTLTRTWTASDACGNAASETQEVVVRDTTPPEGQPNPSQVACLWPPNHKYVCFTRVDFPGGVLVSDACSEPVTWRFIGCESDQCDEAPCDEHPGENGDGNTRNDCVVRANGEGFCVRSERAGAGPNAQAGRRYSVTVAATDACGNTSTGVVAGTIHVPHDQSPATRACRKP